MKNKKLMIVLAISIIICAVVATVVIITLNKTTEYEVYFDVAGGSKIQAQQVEKNKQVIEPKEPVKVGFEFKGWYFNEEKFDFTKPITQNITLTAKWEADGTTTIYTVEFDSAGGTDISPIQISEGQAVTEPKAPTKENFVFDGWYFGESKFDFSITIMQNIKLTAKWTEVTSEENLQVNSNTSTDNNANGNTQNNPSVNDSTTHNNILNEYSKLSGRWYLEGYESIYLEVKANIGNNNINYIVSWDNINLLGDWQLFSLGTVNSINLEEFLNEFNLQTSNSILHISNGNKQLLFSRQKTIFDTSKYDDFIGKWYLPGFGEQSYVEITKEDYNNYRIKCNNFNITTVTKQDGCYTETSEEMSEKVVYNKNTIFDKNNMTLDNGILYIGNGVNKKELTKTPSSAIHNVTGVRLENMELKINVGTSKQFTPIIEPANATNKAVIWSSSNTSIARVNDNGFVETCGLGEATITVRTVDGNYEYHCFLTVTQAPVEGVALSINNANMKIGESKKISIIYTPTYAELGRNVDWKSSNPEVAEVNEYGYIVAKKQGTTVLTVTVEGKSASCTVNVYKVNVQNLTLNHTSVDLIYTTSMELTATIFPEDATNKKITWTSSDPSIVEVYGEGKLYGVSVGRATITAKSEDGVEATCVVNVVYRPIAIYATIEPDIIEGTNGISQYVGVKIERITGGNWEYERKGRFLYNNYSKR